MMSGASEIASAQPTGIPHGAGRWLDASIRQAVVELAFAGACHGMTSEARVILEALPQLVDDAVTRHWLDAALLLALGDTGAARNALTEGDAVADADDIDASDPAKLQVLHRWLAAAQAIPASANDASRDIPTSLSRISRS
ncbi:DUF1039 domain-containing protein [Pandoraea pneumonica]|uniref:DUF1039 domain-containing protein n=1 Tax=Pandoraea pneumonica TaxID=2508299 RepID=UPI003CFB932F